jgi:hypothetical protein
VASHFLSTLISRVVPLSDEFYPPKTPHFSGLIYDGSIAEIDRATDPVTLFRDLLLVTGQSLHAYVIV